MDLLQQQSYFLKLGKCKFEKPSVEFLGWLITQEGVTVDPSKAARLANWPWKLRNVKELRCTLGILGYQWLFIQGYAQLAKPLIELTYNGVPFHWEEQHTETLDRLIHLVTTALVLGCPDPNWQYFLKVDASAFVLGAVLFQYEEHRKRCDVAYFSKALMPPEWNYDVWDQVFLAIVTALWY